MPKLLGVSATVRPKITVPCSLPWAILANTAQSCFRHAALELAQLSITPPTSLPMLCTVSPLLPIHAVVDKPAGSTSLCPGDDCFKTEMWWVRFPGEKTSNCDEEGENSNVPMPDHGSSHKLRSNGKQLTQRRGREETATQLSKTSNNPFVWKIW